MSNRTTVNKKKSKLKIAKNLLFAILFIAVASINDSPNENTKLNDKSNFRTNESSSLASRAKDTFLKHTKKLSIPMVTNILGEFDTIAPGEPFTLTGSFSANQLMQNVVIKWVLPPGVLLLNGSKKSFLTTVEPGKNYEFKVNLKSNSEINQVIHLVAESQIGDSSFSNSSQFQTKLESAFKDSNKRLHDRAVAYDKEQDENNND